MSDDESSNSGNSSSFGSSNETSTDSSYLDKMSVINFSGTVISSTNNKYLILKMLGYGTFSSVWLACNYKNGTFCAIKIHNEDDKDIGLREVKYHEKLKPIKNDYILRINEWFMHKNHVCLVMDIMGASLYSLLKVKHKFTNTNIIDITYQLSSALSVLHKIDINHTDIKPENILIDGSNKYVDMIINKFKASQFYKKIKKYTLAFIIKNAPQTLETMFYDVDEADYNNVNVSEDQLKNIKIKLADFGTCHKLSKPSYEIQTRFYRSPEVILEYPDTSKCDIWSIACLVYELLTGEILFDPKKTGTVNRDKYHVYLFHSIIGSIPLDTIDSSSNKDYYYTQFGILKGIKKVDHISLEKLITDKCKEIKPTVLESFCNLMNTMLVYDISKRYSAEEVMKYVTEHRKDFGA